MMRLLRCLAVVVAALVGTRAAQAIERNFAGSAQIDYHWVPTEHAPQGNRSALDGFTSEIALKVAVDVTDRLSANVKVCHGCHGFELPMAYFDYRVADELTVRAGRFSPSFGSFNLRHDPANHATSSKPLPYDMGRMLRWSTWNLGVLPSPFPDNGIELGGTHWFGERTQLDYAAYAVAGFRAGPTDTDLDWTRSMSSASFLVDNNGRPTVGGRTALTARVGGANDITVGGSIMHGTYDPENNVSYTIAGGDLSGRFGRTQIRMEYLVRRQTFIESPLATFKQPRAADGRGRFTKHGWYLEIERAMTDALTLLVRADGLARFGNLPVDSPLSTRAAVFRYTGAATYALQPGLRIKAGVETWAFSNDFPKHDDLELSFHLALVGTF
jgi:hypothetical protein